MGPGVGAEAAGRLLGVEAEPFGSGVESGEVPGSEDKVICRDSFILEGGITEELTKWNVVEIYTEGDLVKKSVLVRDRF